MNEVDVGAVIGRFNILGMVSDMLFLQYAVENAGDLVRRTHSFIDTVLAVPDPPCDSAGVELPMLFHFSHKTMERNGMKGQPRGQTMTEWQRKLREAKARCAERSATANDDAYAREYFLQPGSQNPAGIALDAFTAVMPCVWYPEMKCSAEFVAQNAATLDASRDARGTPSTGRRSSERKRRRRWVGRRGRSLRAAGGGGSDGNRTVASAFWRDGLGGCRPACRSAVTRGGCAI